MDEPDLPALGVRDLREKVRRRMEELSHEALDNPSVELGLATRIADSLLALIDASDPLDATGKLAVRGAVEYFVLNQDERSDDSTSGLDDDLALLNRTCDAVGLPELKVTS